MDLRVTLCWCSGRGLWQDEAGSGVGKSIAPLLLPRGGASGDGTTFSWSCSDSAMGLGVTSGSASCLLAQLPGEGMCENAFSSFSSQESTERTEHCKNACVLALHFHINNYNVVVGRKTCSF